MKNNVYVAEIVGKEKDSLKDSFYAEANAFCEGNTNRSVTLLALGTI